MKPQRIPMEWMGPPTWRLPSGKALAEFALQSGFLAPLLLGNNSFPRSSGRQPGEVAGTGNDAGSKLTKVSR